MMFPFNPPGTANSVASAGNMAAGPGVPPWKAPVTSKNGVCKVGAAAPPSVSAVCVSLAVPR